MRTARVLKCWHPMLVCIFLLGTSLLSSSFALTASRRSRNGPSVPSSPTTAGTGNNLLFGSFNTQIRVQKPLESLSAKSRRLRRYGNEEYDENLPDGVSSRQRLVDHPTQTMTETLGPSIAPAKPKIVVLGATGKIGRLVVKQLLDMQSIDMTIVAFVRDYDKAIKVLYDDLHVAPSKKSNGPKLQIIEGDLVPPEELPGFRVEETEEEQLWMEKAQSAAEFYGRDIKEYDNRDMLPDINEALEEAIQGCTTVISCVGSVRPTNLWTDFLERPFWRVLQPDVSRWCKDGRHPYYIHYASTRKALGYAEREQVRREAAAIALAEEKNMDVDKIFVPRIRFVRISDLCVGQRPWHFVPLVTNVLQSIVFRYHEMAEQLLSQSTMVETVVLRPGDLVDEERDVNTTSLQVCHTGSVPCPARVGREDVAALAVAAATFPTRNDTTTDNGPFHYTLACRWAGQDMGPYPSQGRKSDGMVDAHTALQRTLKTIYKAEKRSKRRKEALQALKRKHHLNSGLDSEWMIRFASKLQRHRQSPQPHGICVAIPVYLLLALLAKTMLRPLLENVPGGKSLVLSPLNRLNELAMLAITYSIGKLRLLLPWMFTRRKQILLF